jgi:protein involved in polysaccharide export with SLBB domain
MVFAQGVVAEASPALVQFGYDLFQQGEQASFVPAGGALVGPDYVLGPGDEFTVTLWGMVEGTYTVRVSREGIVMFPRVGEVLVAGTTYGDLKKLLEQAFAKQYKNFRLSVTMGELRGIQVFLVGEVQRPGSYKLSSLATVFNALFVCGGPKKSGTLRDIRVVRGTARSLSISISTTFSSMVTSPRTSGFRTKTPCSFRSLALWWQSVGKSIGRRSMSSRGTPP